MVSLGNQEQALVDGLTACLAIALRRSDSYSVDDLGQTKVQKFVYLAAREFDLDLTYSWYLAGSYTEGAAGGESGVKTAFDNLPSPPSPSVDTTDDSATESPSVEEPSYEDISREFEMEKNADTRLGGHDAESTARNDESTDDWDAWLGEAEAQVIPDDFDIPVEEVVTFYQRVLRQYPLHPTDRFLLQFYHYHAPKEYTALYEHCLQLRSILRSAVEDIQTAIDGDPSATEFARHRREFGDHLSEFHLELFGTESVSATADTVVAATEPIEEMFIALANSDPSELTEDHLDVAETMQDFFYYTVWRYPALKISAETATGPSADEVIAEREETYREFDPVVDNRTEELRSRLAEVGLRPELADFPDRDDGVDDTIGDLMSLYQNRSG